MKSNRRKPNTSISSANSIALNKEIPEKLLQKIVKKLKNKIVILLANKFDCLHRYFEQEFWGHLLDNQSLVFDNNFEQSLKNENLLTKTQIDEYKKIFCEKIIDNIRERQNFKIHTASQFNNEILLRYESALINSYHFSNQEYVKAIRLYSQNNE